jgi:glutathione S-transferase
MFRLHRVPHSTNVERVQLALAYKGLEAESVMHSYDDRREVERISGQPLVPVLEHDGRVLADSPRILEYLEEIVPEPPLYPREPARHAEVEIFVDWFNRVWKRPPNDLEAELGKPDPDPARVEELGDAITNALPLFERLLDGRDYLFGDGLSAADVVAFPFLKYAVLWEEGDTYLFHAILRDHMRLDGRYPRLEAWIGRMDALPRS